MAEPEAALLCLSRMGQLKNIGEKYTLVMDIGGGTTDFVAGQVTAEGLHDVRYYGDVHGGSLYDHDIAHSLATWFKLDETDREFAWLELLDYGQMIKERLSQLNDPTEKTAKKIPLELASGDFVTKRFSMSQRDFMEHAKETINVFEKLVLRTLFNIDLRKSDIGQVVLVGGGANLFIVREQLHDIFGNSLPIIYGDPPQVTVAMGASLWYMQKTSPQPNPARRESQETPHPTQPLRGEGEWFPPQIFFCDS